MGGKEIHLLLLFSILEVTHGSSLLTDYNFKVTLPWLESMQNIFDEVDNPKCSNDFQFYLNHNDTEWAFRMFDSSTKIPEGLLMGQSVYLGNFDECITVENVRTQDDSTFSGQHCLAVFTSESKTYNMPQRNDFADSTGFESIRSLLPQGQSLTMAYCIPSSCTANNFQDALNYFLSLENINLTAAVSEMKCHTNKEKSLQTEDWFAVVIIGLIILVVIVSTAYDLTNKGQRKEWLASFSFISNGKKLLNTKSSSDTLDVVHGIRFISICWVLWGHRYTVDIAVPSVNKIALQDLIHDPAYLFITNATLSVDTFLFLSGLLMSYVFLKQMKSKIQGFNVPLYYLHRYIRLTPPYALIMLFEATLLRYLARGPLLTEIVHKMSSNCQKNWWTNLLYVNNYVELKNKCVGQSWYLSVDMQLFWLSPLVLYPLWKFPKKWNVLLLSVLTIGGIVAPFTISYVWEFSPNILTGNLDKSYEMQLYLYSSAYARFGPWIIGVAFGYMIFEAKRKQAKLRTIEIILAWIICNVALLGSMNGIHSFYLPDVEKTALESAFYNGLFRNVWAFGVGLVVFLCVTGYGGPPNAILSWKIFPTLSRLSYCMYLTHAFYQVVQSHSLKTPIYISELIQWPAFFSDVIVSIIMAVLLSLCVEAPVLNLEKFLFKRGGRGQQNKPTERTTITTANEGSRQSTNVDSTVLDIIPEASTEAISNKT